MVSLLNFRYIDGTDLGSLTPGVRLPGWDNLPCLFDYTGNPNYGECTVCVRKVRARHNASSHTFVFTTYHGHEGPARLPSQSPSQGSA